MRRHAAGSRQQPTRAAARACRELPRRAYVPSRHKGEFPGHVTSAGLTAADDILSAALRNGRFTFDHLEVAGLANDDDQNGLESARCTMKLNSELVERTLNQIDAEAISEDHPVVPKLKGLFGDHTFFLDTAGLNIVEPIEMGEIVDPTQERPQRGEVVNRANWHDADPPRLRPHPPLPTDAIVEFGSMH